MTGWAASRDGYDFQNLHRNKRSIALDLKTEEGKKAFFKLAETADVLVENMRVRVKHRLGIAPEQVQAVNPRLIYASISGFGQTGPYSERAGVDQIAQGMGGMMTITGEKGRGPMRAGIPFVDLTAGNLLALAVMMALWERQKTGKGRYVHTSLLEAMVFMLDLQAARYLMDGEVPGQAGNDHPVNIPMGAFDDRRQAGEHRGLQPEDVGAVRRGGGPSRMARGRGMEDREGPQRRPRAAERRDHGGVQAEAVRPLDRPAGTHRHPLRADQQGGPGVRRPAGAASADGDADQHPGPRRHASRLLRRSTWKASTARCAACRRGSASIPPRSWREAGYSDDDVARLRGLGVHRRGVSGMEFADGKILAEIKDGVGRITFNQPEKRNAMSVAMWGGMGDALDLFEKDAAVRCIVLTGAGDKAFVSGADISQFEKIRSDADAQREYSKQTAGGRLKLASFPKPVIAEIRGFCMGGGLGIAMSCDIRIAAEGSQFGIPAARLGIAYGFDMVRHLVDLVGPAHAHMILMTRRALRRARGRALRADQQGRAGRCAGRRDRRADGDHRGQRAAVAVCQQADGAGGAAGPRRSRHGRR